MASKRKTQHYQDLLINKKIKISDNDELPEDTCFHMDNFTEGIETFLKYDYVMNEFVFGIKKTKETESGVKVTTVTFDEIENNGLLNHFSVAMAVGRKYTFKKAAKPADVPFETKPLQNGELGAVLFVKENAYARGTVDLDIRKCFKRENNKYGYTKEGVRMSLDVASRIKEKLKCYQESIKKNVKQTEKIMEMADAALLVREVQALCKYEDDKKTQSRRVAPIKLGEPALLGAFQPKMIRWKFPKTGCQFSRSIGLPLGQLSSPVMK